MSLPKSRMRDSFLRAVKDRMEKEEDIFFLTADFGSPVLDDLQQSFPERFVNVGISEQNLVNVSTGLSLEGYRVIAYAIAPFITMRCLEQIRINLAILSQIRPLNVTLVGVGAGYSYAVSGPTHQALEDIALMRVLPKIKVFTPLDFNQTKQAVRAMIRDDGPSYLRLVRPETIVWPSPPFKIGQAEILKRGARATLIGCGPILAETIIRFEKELIGIEIINCLTIKPLDAEKIIRSINKTKKVITIEDHQIIGGLGSAVAEIMAENKIGAKLTRIGVNDRFGESARDFRLLWEEYLWGPLEEAIRQI